MCSNNFIYRNRWPAGFGPGINSYSTITRINPLEWHMSIWIVRLGEKKSCRRKYMYDITFIKFFKTMQILPNIVWRLILCSNLAGLRDIQRAGKALFLGMTMGVLPEEISIWVGGLSKEAPSPVRVGIIQSVEVLSRTKGRWRRIHSLCLTSDIIFCPWTWTLLVLGPWGLDWECGWLPWFSGLKTGLESLHWLSRASSLQVAYRLGLSAFMMVWANPS